MSEPTISDVVSLSFPLEGIGKVTVSTSRIPKWPETCIFWPKRSEASREESRVCETYATWDDAAKGHVEWLDQSRVARFIHETMRDLNL